MLEPFPRLETKGAKKAKKRKVAKYVRHFFECSKVTPDVYAAFGKASLESSVKAIGETTKILSNTITVEGPACGCNAYWCGGDASYHRTVPNKPCQYCSGC